MRFKEFLSLFNETPDQIFTRKKLIGWNRSKTTPFFHEDDVTVFIKTQYGHWMHEDMMEFMATGLNQILSEDKRFEWSKLQSIISDNIKSLVDHLHKLDFTIVGDLKPGVFYRWMREHHRNREARKIVLISGRLFEEENVLTFWCKKKDLSIEVLQKIVRALNLDTSTLKIQTGDMSRMYVDELPTYQEFIRGSKKPNLDSDEEYQKALSKLHTVSGAGKYKQVFRSRS